MDDTVASRVPRGGRLWLSRLDRRDGAAARVQGLLVALDRAESRLSRVRALCDLWGLSCVRAHAHDANDYQGLRATGGFCERPRFLYSASTFFFRNVEASVVFPVLRSCGSYMRVHVASFGVSFGQELAQMRHERKRLSQQCGAVAV